MKDKTIKIIKKLTKIIKIIRLPFKGIYRLLFPWQHLSKRKQRVLIGIALIVLIIAIPISMYILSHPFGSNAAWFDDNYGYRQRVDITNSGSAQTNYQIVITLNTSALISAGKMQAGCNDIRIVDLTGDLLPYWIETGGSNGCNTTTTKVWTKVTSIPTSGQTIYVYYGNPMAASASDISWMPTGGTITLLSDGHRVHKFTSSGTFTTTANLYVETLVVAGGGGGGMDMGGGGGGGGVIYNSGYAVATGSVTATVGAGGAGAPAAGTGGQPSVHQYTIPATNGENSLIAPATATTFGSSSDTAGKSCYSLKLDGVSTSGAYWIDPDGAGGNSPFQAYCDMTYAGGGWTMMMKATTGTTFNYSSSYWTTTNTLNPSETNTNDGDAKFRSFNEYSVKDLMARWPDISSGTWRWRQDDFNDGNAVVLPTFFTNANLKFFGDAKNFSGWSNGIFSSQVDIRFYGFNFVNNPGYGFNAKVRWGFGWNENGEGLYVNPATLNGGAAPGSDDVSGGIGMDSTFGNYSAGDKINCCQDTTGINRSARVEIYGRNTNDPPDTTTVLAAIGGGHGGSSYYGYTPGAAGAGGGSGGGTSGYSDGSTRAGGIGFSGQGYNGGQGGGQYYSGGGGGAGGVGASATNQPNGGIGVENSILGTSYYWGGGGGGAAYSASTGGNGGNGGGGGGAIGTTTGGAGLNSGSAGGGGACCSWANTPGGNAGANTGGGGGGGSHYNATNKGGDGGSGIVVVSYPSATGPTIASPTNEEKGPSAVAYWKFDEGSGIIASDSSSNGNNGTLTNMTSTAATGGTITTSGGYTIHTFTSSGTFTPNASLTSVEVLVVGGGGGGGGRHGGGGGGGGVRTANLAVTATPYTVTVGAGGTAAPYGGQGGNGGDSVLSTITSTGGGGGGGYNNGAATVNGNPGGSGGGGAEATGLPGGTGTAGAGNTPSTSPSQGNNGGVGLGNGGTNDWAGGGGGGAGAAGGNATAGYQGGTGGVGVASSISGTSTYYGGGGGGAGGNNVDLNGGAGGNGGGGRGTGAYNPTTGVAGTANTGGGGGGSRDAVGTTGGSGIVIVRYPTPISSWKTQSQCIFGKCLGFDGIDDYVDAGNSSNLNVGASDFTVSTWIYPTSTAKKVFLQKSDLNDGWIVGLNTTSNNQIFLEVRENGTTNSQELIYNSTIQANNWYYITIVKTGANITVYKNGVSLGSQTGYQNLSNSSVNFQIGRVDWWPPGYFQGQIDEVKIYNYARSADQVKVDYNNGANVIGSSDASKNLSNGLVGYWKMDESSWTVDCSSESVLDSSGSGNGGASCPNSTGPAGGAVGKFGNAGSFDGSNDYVDIDDSTSLRPSTAISVGAWLKPGSATQAGFGIIDKRYAEGDDPYNSYIIDVEGSTYHYMFCISNGTAGSQTCVYSTTSLTTNWTNVMGTYDGSTMKIYVNGILEGSTPKTGTIGYSSLPLRIGCALAGSQCFNGTIDETRIYNRALDSREVQQLYNFAPGPVGYWDFEDEQNNQNITNGIVGYWKMDDGSGSTASDSSGNGYNGTITGASWSSSCKYGNCLSFSGLSSGNKVDLGTSVNLNPSNFTVSAWVNTNNASYAYNYIFSSDRDCCGTYNGIGFYINGAGKLVGSIWNSTNAGTSSNTTLSASTWYFVTFSYDGSKMKLYINGILDKEESYTGSVGSPASFNVSIGTMGFNQGTYTFNGKIDETRLYNRALSNKEIIQLYGISPANDKSGNGNYGVWNGTPPFYAQGKYGKGGNYDGAGDYVGAGNSSNLQIGTGTMEAWIKTSNAGSGYRGIVVKQSAYGFFLTDNVFTLYDWGAGAGRSSGVNLADGKWHHVAASFQSGVTNGTILYIDGVATLTTTMTVSNQTVSLSFGTGSGTANGQDFNGQIDEVKVYSYVRTSGQVVEDMNAGHPAPGSPVGSPLVHLKFDDGFGNYASNSGSIGGIGNAGLYNIASPATAVSGWNQNGKFGKALSFDGTNDYAKVFDSSSLDITSTITISAWVKLTDVTAYRQVVAKNTTGSGYNDPYALRVEITTGKVSARVGNGAASEDTVVGNTSVSDGKWHYIVMTRDASFLKLYVDGVLDATPVTSTITMFANTTDLRIGSWEGASFYYKGSMDEVKIFNQALTADQVKLEYNRGASQVLGSLSDTSGLTGGSVASNSASAEYCVPGDTTSCASPVGRWDFEEGQGTSTNDISGNGYNGTLTSGPTWTQGKIGKAISFDGSNDYIETNYVLPTTNFTYSFWAKSSASGVANRPFGNADSTAGLSGSGVIWGYNGATHIYVVNRQGANVGTYDIDAVAPGIASGWHQVAVTISSTDGTILYWDGVSIGTNALTTSITSSLTTRIGRHGNGTDAFNGTIDEVKIYNYVRTPAQVAWDYNQGKPVAHWKFDECQGTTANDSSGRGNYGTITAGGSGGNSSVGTCAGSSSMWGDGDNGKFNYSLDFDGTDDDVTSNYSDMDNKYTVSLWMKTTASGNNPWFFNDSSPVGFNEAFIQGTNGTVSVVTKNTSNTAFGADSNSALNDGSWHQVVSVVDWDATYIKLYVDGKLQETTTLSGTRRTDGSNIVIGRRADGGSYYTGQLDDIRIYKYPMTASQVKTLYSGGAINYGPATGAP
ncbi:MAG: DUF2341 domain-containing protein [Candidatus Levybacteria bacterium]|nr:DUF2341 domain-containing protein [Candidatus Levybacteria bacterium]